MSEQESTITFLEGKISVAAALRSPYRTVHRVLLRADRQDRTTRWLQHRAREANVPVEQVCTAEIDAITQGNSHGGVAAEAGQRRFVEMKELLPHGAGSAFVVMLDGIEDPFNFGHALRALYALGAHGLVLRPRNWMNAAATVARASAGASELMPMAVAATVDEAAPSLGTTALLPRPMDNGDWLMLVRKGQFLNLQIVMYAQEAVDIDA